MADRFRFCPQCGTALVAATEATPRPHCPDSACGFVHYGNPTPVVAAIVVHGDCVVLVQNKGWPGAFFGLLTGFLEANEEPADAILREVQEEILVQGTIREFIGAHAFEQMNQVILTWVVDITDEPQVGEELAAIKRIPISRVRSWPMGTGKALTEWLERVRPAPSQA